MAALGEFLWLLWVDRRKAFSWEGNAPEALLCLGALIVLWVNPTPFPYNLVNLVPFAFLLGFRYAVPWGVRAWEAGAPRALLLGTLAFSHVVPFLMATFRHHEWSNQRQKALMGWAEAMTDPVADRVYDAAGLVPTRASIGYHWYLHSLNMVAFGQGRIPTVSRMLTERPAAVIIPNYRTDWLPESEQRFLAERYLPIADDFWVLGGRLPEGGGSFDVKHPGRYVVLGMQQGRLTPLREGSIGGRQLPGGPIQLPVGPIELKVSASVAPLVVWVGPRLGGLPTIGPGDHQYVFVNWY
ncbi:MAG: hypothetical protein HYZ13_08000 [Acidobacteria bacterium]|nr:hypothetical protein [Acidobacteriota bacterium]